MARVPVILVEVVPTGIGGDKQGAGRELAPLIRKDADVAQMSFSKAETRYRMELDVQSYKHTRVIDHEARLDIVRGWIKEAQRTTSELSPHPRILPPPRSSGETATPAECSSCAFAHLRIDPKDPIEVG